MVESSFIFIANIIKIILQRSLLEKKLSESRQQLQDVKSTWSDKITHLEGQVKWIVLLINFLQ